MEKEMLPGNHRNKLPLLCFAPPSHTTLCLDYILFIFIYFSVSLSVFKFLPLRGSFSNCFEAGTLLFSWARNLLFPAPS